MPRRPYSIALTLKGVLRESENKEMTTDELYNDWRLTNRNMKLEILTPRKWFEGVLYGIHCSADWLGMKMNLSQKGNYTWYLIENENNNTN